MASELVVTHDLFGKPLTPAHVYGSEQAMCQAFWKLVHGLKQLGRIKHRYDIIGHENNPRSEVAGSKGKARGVTDGITDYQVLPVNGWLEAKIYKIAGTRKDGTFIYKATQLRSKQIIFAQHVVEDYGHKHEVFRTPDEGIYWLEQWGALV